MTDAIMTEITEQAESTLVRMRDELARIAHTVGEDDPRYIKAATSLARSLSTMLTLKPSKIAADGGALDLYCYSYTGLVFGVNYSGQGTDEHGIGSWSVNS